MNKYRKQAREARQKRKQQKSCTSKVAYPTEAAAAATGGQYYHCSYCGQYHRTEKLNKLLSKVRSNRWFSRVKRKPFK